MENTFERPDHLSEEELKYCENDVKAVTDTYEFMAKKKIEKARISAFGWGLAGGMVVATVLACVGLKKFLKTDNAFDICRLNMWSKYPGCDLQVVNNGIAIWGTNGKGASKFLMGWAANDKEQLARIGNKLIDIAKEAQDGSLDS